MNATLKTTIALITISLTLGAMPVCADPVPPTYTLAAESDTLRLYVDYDTSALIVEDVRNGHLWRSIPADLDDNPVLNDSWRRRIASPIFIGYVGADRRQVKVADISKRGVEVTVTPVKDGVQATYRFTKEGFSLNVLYTLQDDALIITVPEDGITEEGENSLVSVRVLSFLGATHDGDDGYIFFPDGSGALIRYTTPHPKEAQEIARTVYGEDTLTGGNERVFREPVTLPVFGLTHGAAGFIGIITQGDFDSRITVARSGGRVNYNRVGVEFILRRQGLFSLTGGQPIQVYEPTRVGGDRRVRFYFLTGDEADYVGMATRYREYLLAEQGMRRLPVDGPLLHLTLFMGVERKTWFLRDLVTMTTFDQAAAMLNDLATGGVSRLSVTLRGWSKGGDGARYPQRLPVEKRLGGTAGLERLVETAQAHHQPLLLFDDYLDIVPGARGVLPYRDAVRSVNGLPVGDGTTGYFLNPQIARARFAARDLPRLADLGVDGITFRYFAALAVPDTNERHPLTRAEFAATWMKLADDGREWFDMLAMTGGNAYAIPHADLLLGVPLDSTHYDLADETVPFYQIALHGLVAYTGQPYNLAADGRRMFLRQVEYGAMPHFLLTWEDSAHLYRTPANWIWSSRYIDWRGEVIAQYKAMERMADLRDQFIIGHCRLEEGVYQTTYEDGTRIIVNYNPQMRVLDGVPVRGEDFAIVR